MATIMYLLRHAATEANLAQPPLIQGRRHNPALAPLGVRQAELTRDFLAIRAIDVCYCSPMLRAMQTAAIVAAAHGLAPQPLEALTECDVGDWEGMDWQTIRRMDGERHRRFMANPAEHGYPGGESFEDVFRRSSVALDNLLTRHPGRTILVVAHHIVNRTYLAHLLGMPTSKAREVCLDTCGISVITHDCDRSTVSTLNAAFHLQGAAA